MTTPSEKDLKREYYLKKRREYYLENCERERETSRQRHIRRSLREPDYYKNRYVKIKTRSLSMIGKGKVQCVNCGCNDIRLLEINHINGSGTKDYALYIGKSSFIQTIAAGKRKTDDLEVCCRVCNALQYLESKYGIYHIRLNGIIKL